MCFPTLEQPGPCLGVSPSREGVGAGWLAGAHLDSPPTVRTERLAFALT